MSANDQNSKKPWEPNWTRGGRIEAGGQGATYHVSDASGRVAVLKLIHERKERDAAARRRMYQEVSNLRVLHAAGANVPSVLDSNIDRFLDESTRLYFVMERIEGKSLDKVIEDTKPDLVTVLRLVNSLCETVQVAAEEQICHRDVKPQNVIVRDLAAGDAVIVDFGLSFNEQDDLEITLLDEGLDNQFLTLPERRGPSADKRDLRSDITGVVALMHYCLTGCVPRNLRDSKDRAPHQLPGFTVEMVEATQSQRRLLKSLFDKAFQLDLDARFQNVEELTTRLHEIGAPDAMSLQRPPLSEILQRESSTLRRQDKRTQRQECAQRAQALLRYIPEQVRQYSQQAKNTPFEIKVIQPPVLPSEAADGEDLNASVSVLVRAKSHDVEYLVTVGAYMVGNEGVVSQAILRRYCKGGSGGIFGNVPSPAEIVESWRPIVRYMYGVDLDIVAVVASVESAIGDVLVRIREESISSFH